MHYTQGMQELQPLAKLPGDLESLLCGVAVGAHHLFPCVRVLIYLRQGHFTPFHTQIHKLLVLLHGHTADNVGVVVSLY